LSKKPPLQNLGFKWWEHVTQLRKGRFVYGKNRKKHK
jgi:hypothetical protein